VSTPRNILERPVGVVNIAAGRRGPPKPSFSTSTIVNRELVFGNRLCRPARRLAGELLENGYPDNYLRHQPPQRRVLTKYLKDRSLRATGGY
jgi:hypothetical protein